MTACALVSCERPQPQIYIRSATELTILHSCRLHQHEASLEHDGQIDMALLSPKEKYEFAIASPLMALK